MKTQQRKFVVERKSGRRRLTMQPASIWGDTDLKALVREVETDAPHLFEPNMVSDTSGQVSELQTEPTPETHLNDETDSCDQKPTTASPVEGEQNSQAQQGDDLILNAVAQLNLDTPAPRVPGMAKHRRVADDPRQVESTNVAPIVRRTAANVEAPADELIVLEEENRRLKGLLAEHFRQQNMQLRKMLARFSVS